MEPDHSAIALLGDTSLPTLVDHGSSALIYMYIYIYVYIYIYMYIHIYIYIYNLKGPPNGWYRPDWLRFLVPWQLGPRTLDVRGSDYGAPGNRCRQSKKGLCGCSGCTLSDIALVYLVFG